MNPDNPYGLQRPPVPPTPACEVPPIAAPPPHYATAPAPAPAAEARGKLAAIALFVCAGLMLLGLVSHSWFTIEDNEGGVGIMGLERCRRGVCQSVTWFDAKGNLPGEIQLFAGVGILGLAAGIGFLIHTGVVLLMRNPRKVLMTPLNIALGLAAFGTFSFLFRFGFGDLSRGLSWGYAGIVTAAAVIAAGIVIPAIVRPLHKSARQAG